MDIFRYIVNSPFETKLYFIHKHLGTYLFDVLPQIDFLNFLIAECKILKHWA